MSFLDSMKKITQEQKDVELQLKTKKKNEDKEKANASKVFENSDIPGELLYEMATDMANYIKKMLETKIRNRERSEHEYYVCIDFDLKKINYDEEDYYFAFSATPPFFNMSNKYFAIYGGCLNYKSEKHRDQLFKAVIKLLEHDGCKVSYHRRWKKLDRKAYYMRLVASIPCDRYGRIK